MLNAIPTGMTITRSNRQTQRIEKLATGHIRLSDLSQAASLSANFPIQFNKIILTLTLNASPDPDLPAVRPLGGGYGATVPTAAHVTVRSAHRRVTTANRGHLCPPAPLAVPHRPGSGAGLNGAPAHHELPHKTSQIHAVIHSSTLFT